MAEMALTVVVSPLMGVVFDKLRAPILREFGSLYGINDDLETISSALSRIRAVLVDAEKKQITDEATKDWLGKLKDAAYEADDIIDECATEALFFLDSGVNLGSSSSSAQAGKSFLSSIDFKPLRLRRKIAKRIKKIVTKFDGIASEKDKFQLREGVPASLAVEFMQQRETSSVLCEPVVYGRDKDKKNFICPLLNSSNGGSDLQVYPIVGIGGLGKTTFAQLIYNDESIVKAFTTRIWICISEDFSVKRLTKKIIASLSGAECGLEDLDPLQNHLKQLLNEKKFLLVLDDVWNEDAEIWERLRFSLKGGANGSSVVVTTRLHTVAKIMGTCSAYDLTTLSEEDCWVLFKGRAFGMEGEAVESLEAIGKQIAKKCGGVPLVAKALGGSLRFERDASMWKSVRDNEIWKLEQEKGSILPCLRLSYNHLPSYLRECFVYCCVFPKDHEMVVEELIQLWMANGFLESNGTLGLEEAGNHIFNQLVLRSFLQDVRKNHRGKQVCKMHDLMHDLACSVSRKECHALEEGDNLVTIPRSIQHLRIPLDKSFETPLKSSSPLRTCLFFSSEWKYCPQVDFFFKNLTCVRALQLEYHLSSCLPRSMGKMIHLRYLNIQCSKFTRLPKSICNLKNLQTLKLSWCENLLKLPKSLGKLINLRHLELRWCPRLIQLPKRIGELISLVHLGLSGCSRLIQLPDGIGELINLIHLNLSGCERLIQLPEEVGNLINLRYVDLSTCIELIHLPQRFGELVNLIHLDLKDCVKLIQMPIGIGKLSCLETLGMFILGSEDRGSNITELQGLNHLRGHLQIKKLEHVRNGVESEQAKLAAKQNLSSLELRWEYISNNCEDVIQGLQPCHENLEQLSIRRYGGTLFPSWMKLLVNLVEIRLYICPKCEDLPPLGHLPLLKILSICGMDSLKHINKEFYGIITNNSSSGAGVLFPSLEELHFVKLPNWEEWQSPDHQQVFPCLQKLVLSDCPNLASLPFSIRHCVQELRVTGNCEKLAVRSLPCLRLLELASLSSILEDSLHNLDSIESLKLQNCEFASIPQQIKNLAASLKSLEISYCHSLTSFSQSLQHLSSLNTLSIERCDKLEFSSGDFLHLPTLLSLHLSQLRKLTTFPNLQHLPTLQTLKIYGCKNLRTWPQGMQNITSLHALEIRDCHADLHVRCEKDKGEYWPYISYIPQLNIVRGYRW